MASSTTLKNGYLPLQPVREVLNKLMEPHLAVWEAEIQSVQGHGSKKNMMSPWDQLAERSGVSRRGIWRIWNEGQSIHFHTADKLLCALYAAHLWHQPPLDEWYWKVNVEANGPRMKNAA